MNEIRKQNWLFFAEWASIISIFVICFSFLHNQIEKNCSRIDQQISIQSTRTDKLYEMFIDLVKEGKK